MRNLDRKLARRLAKALRSEIEAFRAQTAPGLALRPTVPAQGRMDAISREAYLRRIRFLRDRYHLHWLVDEASGYVSSLDALQDAELVRVQAVLDRARECIADGVPFEDAGLTPASWAAGEPDFSALDHVANHVSRALDGAENVANHVTREPAENPHSSRWFDRPENQF